MTPHLVFKFRDKKRNVLFSPLFRPGKWSLYGPVRKALLLCEGFISGNQGEDYERWNLACPTNYIEAALKRLKNMLINQDPDRQSRLNLRRRDVNIRGPNNVYYVVANSLTNMTFGFDSDEENSELLFSVVEGHTFQPKQLSIDGYSHLLGVSIYSYSIPYLFRIPSSDLSNEFISLDTFLGYDGSVLNEQIALAKNIDQRVNILTDYFFWKLKTRYIEDKLMTNAIKKIKQYNGHVKIMDLAEDFYLSSRQFHSTLSAHRANL